MHRREMVLGENRSNASFKYTRKSVYIKYKHIRCIYTAYCSYLDVRLVWHISIYINIHVLIKMWVPLLAFHVLPNMFPFLM